MEAYRIELIPSTPATTCPFCDTAICDDCGGCHGAGDCPDYHLCGCCEVRDDRGRVVEVYSSQRCGACGLRAPVVFLSGGICPECRA